ncbi:transglutaminase-like domain-containing protein [Thalassobaculum litoreum]|uniref:Tetratricopeptide repeat-containing protein n=1 Tax=Thalassobaculum litoreum DSM 18839 TaxID=1123362 RepID=A0A8G2BIW7_9PROT|nr:transglutaminase-like domain-containing protein [Thalassobaculum litoreum]SDF73802.1 Tetratricopeptide repeat-containing protein [Thalassobaculum litoreum DSM 18839]
MTADPQAGLTVETAGALLDEAAAACAADPNARLDMARLGLALSVLAHPEPEVRPQLSHLEEIAGKAASLAGRDPSQVLPSLMADELGYAGDTDSYEDMINADLAAVIDRRRGLPVALGILYCHAARAAGWDAAGLSFPAHFLIRVDGPGGRHILDPFHGGRAMDAGTMRSLLRHMGAGEDLTAEHHRDVADRLVLLRLQNNIKLRRLQSNDIEGGLAVLARMRRLAPDVAALVMEEAAILAEGGAILGAAKAVKSYLAAGYGAIEDRTEMERFLASIQTRLN